MLFAVADDVVLAWFADLPVATRTSQLTLTVDDRPLAPPYVLFGAGRVEAPGNGVAVLLRHPGGSGALTATQPDGRVHRVALTAEAALPDLVPRLLPESRAVLLRNMLETVPAHLRRNGPALARACAGLLDAAGVVPATAAAAIALGDDRILVRCAARDVGALGGAFRIAADGVRREAGPIDGPNAGRHWILAAIGGAAPVADRLVGFSGSAIWQLRLDSVRPRPADALFRYLEGMKPEGAMRFVQALERWASSAQAPRACALIEDCRVFFGGTARGADGQPVKLFGYGIDAVVPLPDGGVFVRGWLFDPTGRVDRLDAVDAMGTRIALPELWPVVSAEASDRWRNAGLPVPERAGYVAYAQGGVSGPWGIEVVLHSGARFEVTVPSCDPDPRRARDAILISLAASAEIDGAIIHAVAPAVERLHAAHMARYPAAARVRAQVRIGRAIAEPRASLIVPLYRSLNFIGFQEAAFARDPEMDDVEVIYVLDSPEQVEFLEGRLRGEHLIYGRPATMVVHAANLGFAAAVNTGARIARGRDLVLLNSDVIPDEPGWLGPLLAALDRPGVGAAGGQLLYFDDSLQFAGLYFDRSPDGCWFNRHIAKGFPRSYPAANLAREVPALTGACLAVRRTLYDRLGGFDENFVIGDFEDSDFSLRVRAAGLTCWYEPAAVLYHVERQSIDRHEAHGKSVATMVNRWRQHRQWGTVIAELMADAEVRWGVPASMMPEIERLA
ncbi:MAG: glycosyltransferase family 2 protein [Thalassobaculum sp.]|uniref:glycosyltransferase family 2 protein n=1 Tax=Thalassobaculum sp. TaxID=2022740 RepID=UPI0032ED5FFD